MTLRKRISAIRATRSFWRYGSNLAPTLEYLIRSHKYRDCDSAQIVRRLNSDGVAIARIEDFLDYGSIVDFYSEVERLRVAKRVEIEALKANVESDLTVGQKTFNLELLGSEPIFDAECVFARMGLNEKFLTIANGYLKMKARLRYYNIWYTAASMSVLRESQLWHFDREDKLIVKAFVYLDDVEAGTGPFTYAPGTHPKGIHASLKPEFMMEGNVRRTSDTHMEAAYPRADWRVCTGKKGTIIFADTRGYHKGGEARTGDRLMFTCMYTSPASQSKDLIRFPADFDPALLSAEQCKALRIPRK